MRIVARFALSGAVGIGPRAFNGGTEIKWLRARFLQNLIKEKGAGLYLRIHTAGVGILRGTLAVSEDVKN